MKCFNHLNEQAVGVCKHCQKGICENCCTLVDGSVSCRGACESEVESINYIMNKSKGVYKNLDKQWGPATVINGLGGILFFCFGLFTLKSGNMFSYFLLALGLIMFAGGVLSVVQAKRMKDQKDT